MPASSILFHFLTPSLVPYFLLALAFNSLLLPCHAVNFGLSLLLSFFHTFFLLSFSSSSQMFCGSDCVHLPLGMLVQCQCTHGYIITQLQSKLHWLSSAVDIKTQQLQWCGHKYLEAVTIINND